MMPTMGPPVYESELKHLLGVIDSIPSLIHTATPDGYLDYFNRFWLEYVGLPMEDLMGWKWTAVIHPEDLEAIVNKWRSSLASGEPFLHEARVRRADGNYRWMLHRKVAVRDDRGDIVKWYGSSIDIEERKKTEFYLAEGQRLAHTGSWAFNRAGFDYWSSELFQIYGLDAKGKHPTLKEYLGLVHPEDRHFVLQKIQKMLADHRGFDFTKRIVRFDGTIRHVRCVGVPVADGENFQGFVGTGIDVTEQEQLTNNLRKSEMELRQILDLTPQLVAVFGPNRERLYVNRVLLDYVGLSLDEWRLESSNHKSFIHPDDREAVLSHFDHVLSCGSADEVEFRARKSDGRYRWFLARLNPLRDEHGQITHWYAAATDIDDRKRAEERLQQENVALREEIDETSMFEEIVGTSSVLQAVLSSISKVAPSDSTVLITGETGTGKELVARAIHRLSNHASGPFVSVNCSAIPRDLIHSELFGHEKGAFTGATQRHLGRFELADDGTIFLDEVGELLPDTQVALLRVLQEREFERVGGGQPIRVSVRVIAATNRDLKMAVANGTFRQDLFYRLNVFPIEVPPLRERREDILMLVEYFVQRFASNAGKNISSIDKKTLDLMQAYDWPGNIRELQNVIERSVILSSGEVFSVDELWLSKETSRPALQVEALQALQGEVEPRTEREIIVRALAETRGRVSGPSGAAAKLRIPPSTLDHRIRALNIDKKQFKFR